MRANCETASTHDSFYFIFTHSCNPENLEITLNTLFVQHISGSCHFSCLFDPLGLCCFALPRSLSGLGVRQQTTLVNSDNARRHARSTHTRGWTFELKIFLYTDTQQNTHPQGRCTPLLTLNFLSNRMRVMGGWLRWTCVQIKWVICTVSIPLMAISLYLCFPHWMKLQWWVGRTPCSVQENTTRTKAELVQSSCPVLEFHVFWSFVFRRGKQQREVVRATRYQWTFLPFFKIATGFAKHLLGDNSDSTNPVPTSLPLSARQPKMYSFASPSFIRTKFRPLGTRCLFYTSKLFPWWKVYTRFHPMTRTLDKQIQESSICETSKDRFICKKKHALSIALTQTLSQATVSLCRSI